MEFRNAKPNYLCHHLGVYMTNTLYELNFLENQVLLFKRATKGVIHKVRTVSFLGEGD